MLNNLIPKTLPPEYVRQCGVWLGTSPMSFASSTKITQVHLQQPAATQPQTDPATDFWHKALAFFQKIFLKLLRNNTCPLLIFLIDYQDHAVSQTHRSPTLPKFTELSEFSCVCNKKKYCTTEPKKQQSLEWANCGWREVTLSLNRVYYPPTPQKVQMKVPIFQEDARLQWMNMKALPPCYKTALMDKSSIQVLKLKNKTDK